MNYLLALHIEVHGIPAPQGSKRHVGNGVMVESSKKVKPWRAAVKAAALAQTRGLVFYSSGDLSVNVDFYLPRPKSHLSTGRNAGVVKATAPRRPAQYPDLDKLLRATLDGLAEAAVFGNDSQVVSVLARKFYADGVDPGARIRLAREVGPC